MMGKKFRFPIIVLKHRIPNNQAELNAGWLQEV